MHTHIHTYTHTCTYMHAYIHIGSETTLRYAVQLLTPANILRKISKKDVVTVSDINQLAGLFHDAKKSAKFLAENDKMYMQN